MNYLSREHDGHRFDAFGWIGCARRAAIETRLRSMWSQISADVSALAGDGSQEALVQEQLLNWMEQVPAALQHRIPPMSAQDMASRGIHPSINQSRKHRSKC